MKPLPGQLLLFELDACGRPRSGPTQPSKQARRVDERESDQLAPVDDGWPLREKRPTSSPGRSLLSPEDVARRLGLSRKAVYRAVARGELRAARIRSRLRIDPGDLEAWFQANLVDPTGPPTAPVPARLSATTGLRRLLPGT